MSISATVVRFDEHTMWVDLSDGRTLGVPLAWSPRLLHAAPTPPPEPAPIPHCAPPVPAYIPLMPRTKTAARQPDLFAPQPRSQSQTQPPQLPAGLRYQPDLLSADEERALVRELAALPFKEFEFHGFVGKRRVVSFGWRYDFNGGGLTKAEDMPAFLLPIRAKAAAFARIREADLAQALLTEYQPGASIGWHRDRSVFGRVVGLSLLAPCAFRFRRKAGARWERAAFVAEPRSAYLLDGAARREWEHSIPPLERLRYSITFRTLKGR